MNLPAISLNAFRGRYFLYSAIAAALFLALHFCRSYSYLLFHSLAEGFSIAVACGVFMLAWNSRRQMENHFLLFLGIAYLFVAILDLLHTLSYSGMGVFPDHTANLPTQLWIAGRGLESISLLLSPLFLHRKHNPALTLLLFAASTTAVLLLIFTGLFPVCFEEGGGLTTFKITSEYAIVMILFAAATALFLRRRDLDSHVFRLVTASILVTAGAELAFTLYEDPYGLFNEAGHFLKIVSFYLIYHAVIVTGLHRPYDLFYRRLTQSRESLAKSEERFRTVADFTYDMEYWIDQDKTLLYISPSCERITGYTREEFLGDPDLMMRIVHIEDRDLVENHLTVEGRESGTTSMEFRITARDGKIRWIGHQCQPVMFSDGSFHGRRASNRDITSIKNIEMDLRRNRDDLSAANKELESFSHTVSHDLRNPLNNIAAMGELLSTCYGQALDADGNRCVAEINRNAARMNGILADLLRLSGVSHLDLRKTEVPLHLLANDIITGLLRDAPGRVANITIQENLTVTADERLLRLALENLLGNAWKYTAKRPVAEIEVGACRRNGRQVYFVKDNGVGFDPKRATDLFTPFRRLHAASEYPGTGIGLSIVERVIRKHGGTIWAKSAVGCGATFFFTLSP